MKIEQITGLRGVCAFLIAYVLHWILLFNAIPEFRMDIVHDLMGNSATFIYCSANLFFVLSGYLIHQSYHERIKKGDISFANFLFPKIRKIYPLVIVTTIITWILQNVGKSLWGEYLLHDDGGELRNSVSSLVLSVLGFQSGYISDNDYRAVNGPSWFVSILFLCYVLYFCVTRYIKNEYIRRIIYFAMVVLGVCIMCLKPNFPLFYNVNGRGYFSFFVGVLLNEFIKFSQKVPRVIYILALIGFCFSIFVYCNPMIEYSSKMTVIDIFCWPNLVYLTIHGYLFKYIFSNVVLVYLGKIAMPIFLCNFPTQLLIRFIDLLFDLNLDYTNVHLWIVHIVVSLLIAVFAHYVFEQPLKHKRH